MIPVKEAKNIIQSHTPLFPTADLTLTAAAGLTLAAEVRASIAIPAFDQSSMDGYAFRWSDWQPPEPLPIEGEVPAGVSAYFPQPPGKAVRIFTGAPLPDGADTVVMQEKTKQQNGLLHIMDAHLQRGSHVRPEGSEIKPGALALPAGTLLSPPAIGFLAGIGVTNVTVYSTPIVSIIITGNELQTPGEPLAFGQVYESNSWSLSAALQQSGIPDIIVWSVPDDPDQLTAKLEQALSLSQVVLLTGGVSVGDYDFVTKATEQCGVTTQFHRVEQKPGKPLFFGTKGNQLIFGLPGNPSSVLTCFYEYVLPALNKGMGKNGTIMIRQLPLALPYSKKIALTQFLKGLMTHVTVVPLDAQESYRLSSFALANCLICLEPGEREYKAGDLVEVHILPFAT